MANSILSSVAGWVTGQTVFQAVNELTSATVWDKIGVVRVEIPSEAEATNQPLSNIQYKDDGTYFNLLDSDIQSIKIIRPARMRITALCGDLSTLESVIASQKDRTLTLTIYTKNVIANNLIVTDVSITQTPDRMSATEINIELEQGIAPGSASYSPAQSADASAYGFQVQSPQTATQTVSGLFSKVASKVTNVIKPIAGALIGSKGEPFVLDSSMLS